MTTRQSSDWRASDISHVAAGHRALVHYEHFGAAARTLRQRYWRRRLAGVPICCGRSSAARASTEKKMKAFAFLRGLGLGLGFALAAAPSLAQTQMPAIAAADGQSRHFALQQTASVLAMTSLRLSSERIRFHLPWRKPVSRFVLHEVPGKDSERTMIGGRKSADGFSGSQAGHSSLGKKCTSRSHSPPADAG